MTVDTRRGTVTESMWRVMPLGILICPVVAMIEPTWRYGGVVAVPFAALAASAIQTALFVAFYERMTGREREGSVLMLARELWPFYLVLAMIGVSGGYGLYSLSALLGWVRR